jgi:hypothetical protein
MTLDAQHGTRSRGPLLHDDQPKLFWLGVGRIKAFAVVANL